MSSGSSGAGYTGVYIFLAILVLIVIRRLRVVLKGSKVSVARTWIFSGYYAILAAFFSLSGISRSFDMPANPLMAMPPRQTPTPAMTTRPEVQINVWDTNS